MDTAGEADAFLASLQAEVQPQENGVIKTEPAIKTEQAPRKRGRERWGPPIGAEPDKAAETNGTQPRKRKSRWEKAEPNTNRSLITVPREVTLPGGIKVALPAALLGGAGVSDPKVKALYDELEVITKKIQTNDLGIPPENQRSPSPEPVYDRNGIRLNTREVRAKERLMERRSELIEGLIVADPAYRPPSDYRPAKKWRKVFIPQRDFPSYNFIGLIIGPRGNTQKRMQKETNTKIAIRGKGSVKEGAIRDPKYDYGEDEELHVLITGDRQEDADKAAQMIEELLVPTDETRNEHKRLQLRELAALNGTLKDDQHCYLCGQSGHRQFECPTQAQTDFQLPLAVKEQVDALYQRDVARMGGTTDNSNEDYKKFAAEMGFSDGPSTSAAGPAPEREYSRSRPSFQDFENGGFERQRGRPGDDLPDDCKLYVGSLSPVITDSVLKQLFEPFGTVLHAVVLLDHISNTSRGYGFVHMDNTTSAANAVRGLNGKDVDGKSMVVRLRSEGKPAPGGHGPPVDDGAKLYIACIPHHLDEPALESMFGQFGKVVSCRSIMDRDTGRPKGYGFVSMDSPAAAQAAVNALNGWQAGPQARPMTVKIADRRDGNGGPPQGMPAFNAPAHDQGHMGSRWAPPQAQPPLPSQHPGQDFRPPLPSQQPPLPYAPAQGAPPPLPAGPGPAPPGPMQHFRPPPQQYMHAPPPYGRPMGPGGQPRPMQPGYPGMPPYMAQHPPGPGMSHSYVSNQPPPAPYAAAPLPQQPPARPQGQADLVQSEYERFMQEMQGNKF